MLSIGNVVLPEVSPILFRGTNMDKSLSEVIRELTVGIYLVGLGHTGHSQLSKVPLPLCQATSFLRTKSTC